ncbi:TetR/AcrR family transcriptional regulator [Nocardioides maradonensis]
MSSTRPRGRPAGSTGSDLLAVAREVFLERGYAGATMDEIAARARISKASLYREHPSKQRLFAAVVDDWASAGRDAMRPFLDRLADGTDTRAGLVELAEAMRAGILSAPVLRMRRLVTSEAERFPEVAGRYLEASWERNVQALAGVLAGLDAQGRLRVADTRVAAEQLSWLVIGAPLNRLLLTGGEAHGEVGGPVTAAVDLFLAGYGPG